MAPSEKALIKALKDSVAAILGSDERDRLSVTLARTKAEADLGLPDQFFKVADWKSKSKEIILKEHERLLELEADDKPDVATQSQPSPVEPKQAAKLASKLNTKTSKAGASSSKAGVKRSSDSNSKPRPPKRQRKELTPSDDEESELSSATSESQSDGVSDEASQDPSEDSEFSDVSVGKTRGNQKASATSAAQSNSKNPPQVARGQSTSQSSVSKARVVSDSEDEPSGNEDSKQVTEADDANNSESDMSVLIDEAPNRNKKAKSSSAKRSSVTTKSVPKAPVDVSPEEQELKTLQSQLKKCGVNKIWGFELKQFGDDIKAKIRYLKKMLNEVGMEGRFSEVRAKKIRVRRELLAEVEEITAVAELVGKPRARRSRS